jgi:hypothetical protein
MGLSKKASYISASQISQFLFCPVAYYKIYYERAEKMPPNIYMIYGSAIHEALAYNFKQKITSRKDLPVKEVLEVFKTCFIKELDKYSIYKNIVIQREGYKCLEHYMSNVAPNIQPVMVEEKFEIPLKNFPFTIMGYIDLVDENGFIIDHKSAGKNWRSKWKKPNVDKDMQLTLYAVAYRKLFKKRETGLCIDILPRDKILYHRIKTCRTDEQIMNLLNLMTNMEKICQLGVFAPSLNNCNDCPFAITCKKQMILNKT